MVCDRGGEMPAGRPTADEDLSAVEAKVHGMVGEVGDRLPDLVHDLGHARIRTKRVARPREVDAVRAWALRHEREALLLVALPVPAVDEHEQRRARLCGKIIECR